MTDLQTLPERFTARPATDADLDAVVRLIDDADRDLGLDPDPMREYLTWIWHVPSTDLTRDTRIVQRGVQVAGFAQMIWNPEEGGPLDAFVRVHPDHQGLGIEAWALSWAERLASERGSEGVRARVPDRDASAGSLLTSLGYVQVRSSWTMGRRLSPDEDAGLPPAGVVIRTFETGRDERALHEVHNASFADHWGFRPVPYETFAAEMYGAESWDPSLVYVAEAHGADADGDDADGRTVGYLVGLSFDAEGYVAVLGVLPGWRGRGIAKALLGRSFADLAKRGHEEVRLNVDAQNPTGAVALYESVGMTPYRVYDVFDLGTPDAAHERAAGTGAASSSEG